MTVHWRMVCWLFCGSVGAFAGGGEPFTIVHAGKLLDRPGQAPRSRVSIVVRAGSIERVVDGFIGAGELGLDAGEQVKTIDLSRHFVLPGLIDCHTHVLASTGAMSLAGITRWSDAKWALGALPNLEKVLHAGFTTVRNVGEMNGAIYDLREAQAEGLFQGPRILAVREMLTPSGGHGDRHPFRPEVQIPEPLSTCDGPYDCRGKVREIAFRGADLIKIKVTAGVFSGSGFFPDHMFFEDELKEIVAAAHALNLLAAAHALTAESANAALRAGVDSIEHCQDLNDESIRLLLQKDAFLVPTLMASVGLAVSDGDPDGDPKQRWLAGIDEMAKRSAGRAVAAGVKIAFGTDSGVIAHGDNAQEFRYLVEVGMSPMAAIQSATVNAAELLGLSDEVGSLEPGKRADIIAVAGDPLDDIRRLESVVFVMQDGKVVKLPSP